MKAYRGYGAVKQDAINDLDCPECGGWFHSFSALADHVTTIHKPRNQREKAEQQDSMAQLPKSKRSEAPKKAASSGRIPGASRDNASDYNPFLKAADIGDVGTAAKLTLTGSVRVSDGQFGEQIISEVKYRNSAYDWAVKLNSPNHRHLEDMLGLDTRKWKGKQIAVVIKENMGRDYIAIERPAAKGRK